MWHILKAELSNNKVEIIVPSSFVLFGMIINIILGWENVELDLPGVRSLMSSTITLLLIFNFIKQMKEKRIRMISVLPLPIKRVAMARLLYIVFIWTSYMVLYWISSSTARPYNYKLIFWDTLSVTGLILFINAFPFFFRDFSFLFNEKYKTVILTILMVIIFILCYIIIFSFGINEYSWEIFQILLPLRKSLEIFSSTPCGAIIFIIFGLTFSVLNIFTFNLRKSYLD